MRRYTATLTATFTIEAENIVEARHAVRRIRALGEVTGIRRPGHSRDAIRYVVTKATERLTVAPGDTKKGDAP